MWDIPPGNTALIQMVKDGTATLGDLTGGGATQGSETPGPPTFTCSPRFPGTFPARGSYTAPLYAASGPGVKPTACAPADPGALRCQLSGKRLLSNAEWLAASAGTVDTNTDNGTTDCNTNAPGAGVNAPVNTGSRSACASTSGIYDQIGNVWEWTLDLKRDFFTGVPSAETWIRGGDWSAARVPHCPTAIRSIPSTPTSVSAFGVGGSRGSRGRLPGRPAEPEQGARGSAARSRPLHGAGAHAFRTTRRVPLAVSWPNRPRSRPGR